VRAFPTLLRTCTKLQRCCNWLHVRVRRTNEFDASVNPHLSFVGISKASVNAASHKQSEGMSPVASCFNP
jgi:hypothetical protein